MTQHGANEERAQRPTNHPRRSWRVKRASPLKTREAGRGVPFLRFFFASSFSSSDKRPKVRSHHITDCNDSSKQCSSGPFPRETLFGPKKKRLRQAASQNAHFFCRKNGKKHQNRHEMVIHGSKWDVDHTKMIRKTRSTKPRSSYCAKTLKMRV